MFLFTFDIDGTDHRISTEGYELEHFWKPKVASFKKPAYRTQFDYGGWVMLDIGEIGFVPDLFDSDWPPPLTGDIKMEYTTTTEAAADTISEGYAYLKKINYKEVVYDVVGTEHTNQLASATAYNDTLVNVFTDLCGAGKLNLTLDSTAARDPSPNVTHTTSGKQLTINFASKLAAFYTHCFYIEGTTLYLIDMLADNGSRTLTEHQYFPSNYNYNRFVSQITNTTVSRFSTYPAGQVMRVTAYHDTAANVETCFDNIMTVINSPTCALELPFTSKPEPGEKISWSDTKLGQDTDAWIRARDITYDFDAMIATISGEGAITAG